MMTGAWGMTLGGWIWMAVWIVALLVMIWLVVGGWRRESTKDDPRDLLRTRYARGEISEDEYRHALQILDEPIGGTS